MVLVEIADRVVDKDGFLHGLCNFDRDCAWFSDFIALVVVSLGYFHDFAVYNINPDSQSNKYNSYLIIIVVSKDVKELPKRKNMKNVELIVG